MHCYYLPKLLPCLMHRYMCCWQSVLWCMQAAQQMHLGPEAAPEAADEILLREWKAKSSCASAVHDSRYSNLTSFFPSLTCPLQLPPGVAAAHVAVCALLGKEKRKDYVSQRGLCALSACGCTCPISVRALSLLLMSSKQCRRRGERGQWWRSQAVSRGCRPSPAGRGDGPVPPCPHLLPNIKCETIMVSHFMILSPARPSATVTFWAVQSQEGLHPGAHHTAFISVDKHRHFLLSSFCAASFVKGRVVLTITCKVQPPFHASNVYHYAMQDPLCSH
eukprot:scaffold140014_cov18-Tisochrysis_lutea.AAC.2